MALSPEAKELKRQQTAKYMHKHWIKKAQQYGIPTEGREAEAINEAKKRYDDEYWERKAKEALK